jgi:hypothetical protein
MQINHGDVVVHCNEIRDARQERVVVHCNEISDARQDRDGK